MEEEKAALDSGHWPGTPGPGVARRALVCSCEHNSTEHQTRQGHSAPMMGQDKSSLNSKIVQTQEDCPTTNMTRWPPILATMSDFCFLTRTLSASFLLPSR